MTIRDMKFDEGKLLGSILHEDFPQALQDVIRVATFGAAKYERSSWKTVSNSHQRYADALHRHLLAIALGEVVDEESGLPHYAHAAWNCLALAQLRHLEKLNIKQPLTLDITKLTGGYPPAFMPPENTPQPIIEFRTVCIIRDDGTPKYVSVHHTHVIQSGTSFGITNPDIVVCTKCNTTIRDSLLTPCKGAQ